MPMKAQRHRHRRITRRIRSWLAALAVAAPSVAVQAHHSVLGFDGEELTTIFGAVVRVAWQFPHVHLVVAVQHQGDRETWTVESEAPQVLARLGWKPDAVKVGDLVTVRGARARDGRLALRCVTVGLAGGLTLQCFPAAPGAGVEP
jgi:Family of unknown function (DUF6152)